MYGYKKARGHIADEITLLCDKHHKEKTNNLLPLAHVLQANRKPINVSMGVSEPYGLHYSGVNCLVRMGSLWFSGERSKLVPLLMNDDEVVAFHFEEGQIFLSSCIRAEGGDIALLIDKNEVIYSTDAWDVEFVGNTLTIRSAFRDILIRIRFRPPSTIDVLRMNVTYRGVTAKLNGRGLYVNGPGGRKRTFERGSFSGLQYGLILDSNPSGEQMNAAVLL